MKKPSVKPFFDVTVYFILALVSSFVPLQVNADDNPFKCSSTGVDCLIAGYGVDQYSWLVEPSNDTGAVIWGGKLMADLQSQSSNMRQQMLQNYLTPLNTDITNVLTTIDPTAINMTGGFFLQAPILSTSACKTADSKSLCLEMANMGAQGIPYFNLDTLLGPTSYPEKSSRQATAPITAAQNFVRFVSGMMIPMPVADFSKLSFTGKSTSSSSSSSNSSSSSDNSSDNSTGSDTSGSSGSSSDSSNTTSSDSSSSSSNSSGSVTSGSSGTSSDSSSGTPLYATTIMQPAVTAYLSTLRTYAAQVGAGLSNLYHLYAERVPITNLQIPAGPNKGSKTSPLGMEAYLANRRISSAEWYQQMQQASPAEISRQTLFLLAEMRQEMFKERMELERIDAILSIMELQQTSSERIAVTTAAGNLPSPLSGDSSSDDNSSSSSSS